MLQKLRDKTTGWVASVILGLLTVPFAFFGIESYVSQNVDSYVARIAQPPSWWTSAPQVWPLTYFWKVDDIDSQAYRDRLESVRMRMRDQQGDNFDAKAFESPENKRRIVDAMVDDELMRLAAERDRLVVSDAEVRATIQRMPDFQVDGAFNAERYQLLLASQNPPMTPRSFEARIRDSLRDDLIPSRIARSAFVTDHELDRLMRLLGEHRDIAFVAIPPAAPDRAQVTDAQVDAWYKAHPADFRKPETVRLEYIEVTAADLPAADADEGALRRTYQEQSAKYASAEKRDIAHILVAVPADAGDGARKAAEARAKDLAAQARAPGADFAALARANSDDSGSKDKGGDLGLIAKGGMPGAFDDAAFSMKEGEIRGPVKTDFGWHVIQLRKIEGGAQRPFEEVREELARELQEGARERAFNELTGKLVDAVYKTPTSLQPAAKAMGLTVKTTPAFTRAGGEGIASDPKVARAAFSENLLQDGTASDPIELGPEHTVLIRVIDHSPETALPLAQVRDAVVAAIRADRQQKAALGAADALLAAAKEKGLAAAAQGMGLAVNDVRDVPRGAQEPMRQLVEAFFNVPRPKDGKPVVAKTRVAGQYVVFSVLTARDGDLGQVTAAERDQLRQQVSAANGMQAQEAFIRAARAKYRIKVAEDRL